MRRCYSVLPPLDTPGDGNLSVATNGYQYHQALGTVSSSLLVYSFNVLQKYKFATATKRQGSLLDLDGRSDDRRVGHSEIDCSMGLAIHSDDHMMVVRMAAALVEGVPAHHTADYSQIAEEDTAGVDHRTVVGAGCVQPLKSHTEVVALGKVSLCVKQRFQHSLQYCCPWESGLW